MLEKTRPVRLLEHLEHGYDDPQIGYYDGTNKDLEHISWTGSEWSLPVIVDSDCNVGSDTSLVLDLSGNAHISYFDDTNDDGKNAHWT